MPQPGVGEPPGAPLPSLSGLLDARDANWNAPAWLRAALVAAALGLLAMRFADRDLVTYVLDEPQLQDAAQADASRGAWARISVLTGTQGVRYGPAPLWFYTAVHRLAGPLPERSILATTLLLTLAQLGLALAVARALGGGAVVFATCVALLAASPYLFYWSRTGWDNPLLGAFAAGAVAVLLLDRLPALLRGLLLGALVGLGLSTHLMAIPFAVAAAGLLAAEGLRRRQARIELGALLAAALLVNLPYLGALRAEPPRAPPAAAHWGGPGAVARVAFELLEPARVIVASGIERFLDSAAAGFQARLGPARVVLDAGPLLAVVLALGAAAGLAWAARSAQSARRRLGRLGALLWVGQALFLGLPALAPEPHYQQPTAWLVPAGACALSMALLPRSPRLAGFILGGLWMVALAQGAVLEAWMGWMRVEGGTASLRYSVPLAAQRDLVHAACDTDRPGIALANWTVLFPHSLLSVARTEAACDGKRVVVCPGSCPPLDPGRWRVVPVRYLAPPGGRLVAPGG